HQRVVRGRIAVRVVLAEHVTGHARALHVGTRVDVVALLHREQDAAMHGLQSVAHVRQGAPDDDAHRIVEIRLAHLVFEVDVQNLARDIGHAVLYRTFIFRYWMTPAADAPPVNKTLYGTLFRQLSVPRKPVATQW